MLLTSAPPGIVLQEVFGRTALSVLQLFLALGIIAAAMLAILAWLLTRSMQETRGLFWAWFIHFWYDMGSSRSCHRRHHPRR